jgi:hypothetical protein
MDDDDEVNDSEEDNDDGNDTEVSQQHRGWPAAYEEVKMTSIGCVSRAEDKNLGLAGFYVPKVMRGVKMPDMNVKSRLIEDSLEAMDMPMGASAVTPPLQV